MFAIAWMVFTGMLAGAPAVDSSADTPQVVIDGTLRTPDGTERTAKLAITCKPGQGGTLAMHLQLMSTARLNFDLDVYEGPNTPASKKPSAHLSAGSQQAPALISVGAYGSRGQAPYTFTVSQAMTGPAPVAKKGKRAPKGATAKSAPASLLRVAEALGIAGGELTWTQDASRSGEKPLVAHFAPETWQTQQIADEIKPCVTPSR
jgi:hypothetical protein